MKKAFCFSLIVMFLALAGFIPVRADDVTVITPYVDSPTLTNEQIINIENASLLLEYLRKGGTIDVKNTSSDYDADDLLSDFGNFVRDVVGDFVDIVNPFQTEVEYHGLQPISPAKSAIVQFMGALPFYALQPPEDEPTPTPTPPLDYQSYIDTINGIFPSCFFWGGSTLSYPNTSSYINATLNGQSQSYSYCSSSYGIVTGSTTTSSMYICPITDVYIVNVSEGQYQFNTRFTATCWGQLDHNVWGSPIYCYTGQINGSTITPSGRNASNDYTGMYKNLTYSGTLTQCLQYLTNYCRNINIYVDGVPWSIVGNTNPPVYNIDISTGTTVPIKDGTGKVEWLYDYEIYFDIDRIQDDLNTLLNYIRNNPQSPTIIKFDDLDDVIVDVNGQPAVAVKVLADTRNIDQIYIDNYGPIIPAFLPLFTPVIDDVDIIKIADTAVSPIPSDLLEVFGYMFMGVLFVGFIHRLLE